MRLIAQADPFPLVLARGNLRQSHESFDFVLARAPCMVGDMKNTQTRTELELRHGELVRPNEISVSAFLQEVVERAKGNDAFDGSFEELVELTKAHFHDREPGTGSVEGDVVLVNVPPARFRTNIVSLDAHNAPDARLRWRERVAGEDSVGTVVIVSEAPLPPARFVQIVCYRADTLARDAGRSSDAEWEIVAINAQLDRVTPMEPTTMLRNALHETGGTERAYTAEQWLEAVAHWSRHARVVRPEKLRG